MSAAPEAVYALRIRTPRIELRIPDDADVEELLAVARRGVHDPTEMPFQVAWTDTPKGQFDEQFRSFHRSVRETWGASNWKAAFVTVARDRDGIIIGSQGASSKQERDYPVTGSWLGLEFQSQGYGSEMRAAILAFLFDELRCVSVESGAFAYNEKSLGVSRKLGYVETGRETHAPRGIPQESIRLDRAAYLRHRPRIEVEITGTDAVSRVFPVQRAVQR